MGALLRSYRAVELLEEREGTAIWRALRESDGVRVVLKLADGKERHHAHRADALKHEYGVLSRFDTSSVLRAHALLEQDGVTALVLEDLDGVSLHRSLGQPMDARRFLRDAPRIAAALAEVHARQVLHKDIKPSNILPWRTGKRTANKRNYRFHLANMVLR
jgi:serine/threonine protein kinase